MSGTARYDVLIAGAGPAGIHTALRLARRGLEVAVLDRATFPRPKPCGEFLSPACLPLLEELGLLDELLAEGAVRVSGMQIETPRHRTRGSYRALGPFPTPAGGGLGVRRELLDHLAVRAAERTPGITVHTGYAVTGPVVRDDRVVGLVARTPGDEVEELRARFVVGADGIRSRVARGLGLLEPPSGRGRFALVARFADVPDRENAALHVVGRDYFAACPIDGGAFTANLVVDGGVIPKGADGLEAYFLSRAEESPGLSARLAGARPSEPVVACGPLRTEVRRCAGPGFALVGDACGFVDPMTGEGLYFAMQGAAWLADALDEALRHPDREERALGRYVRARRFELGPRYALARMLQVGLRRPGVPDRLVGGLARVPALLNVVLGLTGDYLPPRGLLLPSVWRSAAG